MHPEIAPNAYNNWLHKHGVDSTGQSTFLAVRKSSVNRRRSVLSAEYNPELDDEDDERAPATRSLDPVQESKESIHGYNVETNTDFLSGVFSAPLEQMGEPPLKTKTSLRRSLSHTRNAPSHGRFFLFFFLRIFTVWIGNTPQVMTLTGYTLQLC